MGKTYKREAREPKDARLARADARFREQRLGLDRCATCRGRVAADGVCWSCDGATAFYDARVHYGP